MHAGSAAIADDLVCACAVLRCACSGNPLTMLSGQLEHSWLRHVCISGMSAKGDRLSLKHSQLLKTLDAADSKLKVTTSAGVHTVWMSTPCGCPHRVDVHTTLYRASSPSSRCRGLVAIAFAVARRRRWRLGSSAARLWKS
jgi:hypothetical protein